MGTLGCAVAALTLLLPSLCGATPLASCASVGARAVLNASGVCTAPVAPELSYSPVLVAPATNLSFGTVSVTPDMDRELSLSLAHSPVHIL